MYTRRGEPCDKDWMVPLLSAALAQFHELGMTGWIRPAKELQKG